MLIVFQKLLILCEGIHSVNTFNTFLIQCIIQGQVELSLLAFFVLSCYLFVCEQSICLTSRMVILKNQPGSQKKNYNSIFRGTYNFVVGHLCMSQLLTARLYDK